MNMLYKKCNIYSVCLTFSIFVCVAHAYKLVNAQDDQRKNEVLLLRKTGDSCVAPKNAKNHHVCINMLQVLKFSVCEEEHL